jgi:hypothetical protein
MFLSKRGGTTHRTIHKYLSTTPYYKIWTWISIKTWFNCTGHELLLLNKIRFSFESKC